MAHITLAVLLLAVVASADERKIFKDGSLLNNWKLKNPDHLQVYCVRAKDRRWIGVDMIPGSQIVFSTNTPDSTASNYKNLHFNARFENDNLDNVALSVGGSPLSYSQLVLNPDAKADATAKTNIYNGYNGYTVRVKENKDNKINIPLTALDNSGKLQSFYIQRAGSGTGVQRIWFDDVKFDSNGDATDQYNGAPACGILLLSLLFVFMLF